MTDQPLFIRIDTLPGVTDTDVQLLQIAHIGSVSFSRYQATAITIHAPRDMEGSNTIVFDSITRAKWFVEVLTKVLNAHDMLIELED